MSALLIISVGPVQEFIANARRTRDLWFGSTILSEISKAIALRLFTSHGIELIFPSPISPRDLEPDSDFNASNVILCKAEQEVSIKELCGDLHKGAKARWSALGESALQDIPEKWLVRSMWNAQVDSALEFYAAWLPMNNDGEYANQTAGGVACAAGRSSRT